MEVNLNCYNIKKAESPPPFTLFMTVVVYAAGAGPLSSPIPATDGVG